MKYNVGDKVRIKSLEWYKNNRDLYGHIVFPREDEEDVEFDSLHAEYCGQIMTIRLIVYGSRYVMEDDIHESEWTDEMIEGIVEEESEKKLSDESWRYKNIFDHSQYPQSFECPNGYIFKDENGNVINATKIVLEKKKKWYPKTYKECRDYIESCHVEPFCADLIATGYKSKLIESFARLLICRDAYWKIAGEEMGLGKPWEPDWNIRGYYAIARSYGNVIKTSNYNCDLTFVFPTAEMRDAFKENFDPDIEICKEFL